MILAQLNRDGKYHIVVYAAKEDTQLMEDGSYLRKYETLCRHGHTISPPVDVEADISTEEAGSYDICGNCLNKTDQMYHQIVKMMSGDGLEIVTHLNEVKELR